jgi:Fur family ferric uptake transcriptional regulator
MVEAHAVFNDYLDRKRLKMTPQRKLIVDVFLEQGGHLASEELYNVVKQKDRTIGQATVYRTLKLLSDSGIAKEVHFGDGVTRYERSLGEGHHDHIICEACNKTIEVMDEEIERLQEELAAKEGFKLTGHKMYLYGVCGECRTKNS